MVGRVKPFIKVLWEWLEGEVRWGQLVKRAHNGRLQFISIGFSDFLIALTLFDLAQTSNWNRNQRKAGRDGRGGDGLV